MRYEQRLRSASGGARPGGTGDGAGAEGHGREGGTLYKLGGMTEEQRQKMLDLREEVGRTRSNLHVRVTLATC